MTSLFILTPTESIFDSFNLILSTQNGHTRQSHSQTEGNPVRMHVRDQSTNPIDSMLCTKAAGAGFGARHMKHGHVIQLAYMSVTYWTQTQEDTRKHEQTR